MLPIQKSEECWKHSKCRHGEEWVKNQLRTECVMRKNWRDWNRRDESYWRQYRREKEMVRTLVVLRLYTKGCN